MKQKFSTSWKSSKQPRKQRKFRANAPIHIARKFMAANLSKDLRKKHERRSFPIKKGDTVKIMRGKFTKKTGKIASVSIKRQRVSIEGMQSKKLDGTSVNVWFNPSNLQITDINLDDKKRLNSINKKLKSENTEETKNAPEKK
ncbi:MAG: 50S ribosomal protein L24 [Nanoarchaeota archaeon]|nr:50S ribosomal protein L24 [Nanoarchaeota archaeon]